MRRVKLVSIHALLIFIAVASVHRAEAGLRLSDTIGYYEVLTYDTNPVQEEHARVRRSLSTYSQVAINFWSHGKEFRLRLKRDVETFSPGFILENSVGSDSVDTAHLFFGHLHGVPGSSVYGSLHDGVFEGNIEMPEGTYYVERANHYFPQNQRRHFDFHSVIYSENVVEEPKSPSRQQAEFGSCGLNETREEWMHQIQSSMETPPQTVEDVDWESVWEQENPALKYLSREKRASLVRGKLATFSPRGGIGNGNNNSTCELFIRTDPMLYKYYLDHEDLPEVRVKEEIVSLVQLLVKAISHIYSNTRFNMGRFNHSGITFTVQRLRVDNYTQDCRYGHSLNPFCNPSVDVTSFLTQFSQDNHDAFCLAIMLTFRDFADGTLGLAWVASPNRGNKGGVCERRGRIANQKQELSLNTAVVTFLNYASKVTPKVSQLTLAHEIGHNFGAAHDPDNVFSCVPGQLQGGNYIMYRHATKGNLPNNRKFSECSIRNMSLVLDAIYLSLHVENGKFYCFKASNLTFCGNRIVEEGEECDCGFDDDECRHDPCCSPRISSNGEQNSNACKLKHGPGSCSPSQGPCCDSKTCGVVLPERQLECAKESDCKYHSICDGRHPQCPSPPNKPDFTECNTNTQVCVHGECSGAYCLKWGLQECFLTSDVIQDKHKLCELACQEQDRPHTCVSTSVLVANGSRAHNYSVIHLMPGSACDNYQGYCDVFQMCRRVDEEGPLLRIKNLLFGSETLETIRDWITSKWWAVVLIGLSMVICTGGFIKCCAVHTPSSNPKQPPARRLTDTFVYGPMTTARRMGSAANSTLRRLVLHTGITIQLPMCPMDNAITITMEVVGNDTEGPHHRADPDPLFRLITLSQPLPWPLFHRVGLRGEQEPKHVLLISAQNWQDREHHGAKVKLEQIPLEVRRQKR
ncbi:unnamed protein product [Darwinula stevensoni]|uniref:ADAM10 endopeptidase n=1 Tax=Darwinula stevensoni TaxID=69355 RepID=A0A7R8X2G7_9CRUS|nr:unnamed protein product [Darwinula stevensoni]CAG0883895.1 unnamed protein product [Darwinula stevensoni]